MTPPALFHGVTEHMPNQAITGFLVKQAGLEISDPTHTEKVNWTVLYVVTGNLVAALWDCVKFCSEYHTQLLTDGSKDIRQQKGQ